MAAFQDVAPILARQGVAAIPTDPAKPSKPLVQQPGRLTYGAAMELSRRPRFNDANAGIICGPTSGLAVVDVDSPDPTQHDAAREMFGDTPVQVSTPSGGLHLFYRHNGERRLIRPFGRAVPVDLIGGGLAVLPPSRRSRSSEKAGGAYRLISGGLDALHDLPTIDGQKIPEAHTDPLTAAPGQSRQIPTPGTSGRNDACFRYAMANVMGALDFDSLLALCVSWNMALERPLDAAEVIKTARSAWRYRELDSVWVGGEARAVLSHSELSQINGNSDAALLLMHLRAAHGWRDGAPFALANAMAKSLGWGVRRLRNARQWLSASGFLSEVTPGGMGPNDPPMYRFPKGGQNDHQYNSTPLPPSETTRGQSTNETPTGPGDGEGW